MTTPPPIPSTSHGKPTNPVAQAQLDKLNATQEKANREGLGAKAAQKKKKKMKSKSIDTSSSTPSTPVQGPATLPDPVTHLEIPKASAQSEREREAQEEAKHQVEAAKSLKVAQQLQAVRVEAEARQLAEEKKRKAAEAEKTLAEEKEQADAAAEAARREEEAAEMIRQEQQAAEELANFKLQAQEEADRRAREEAERTAAQIRAEVAIHQARCEAEEAKKLAEEQAEEAREAIRRSEVEATARAVAECEQFKRMTTLEFQERQIRQEAEINARRAELEAQQDEMRKTMEMEMEASRREYEARRAEDIAEAQEQLLRLRERIEATQESRPAELDTHHARDHGHWEESTRHERRHAHMNHHRPLSRSSSSPRRRSLQEVVTAQDHTLHDHDDKRPLEYEQVMTGHQNHIHRPIPHTRSVPPRELTDIRITIQDDSNAASKTGKLCFMLELPTFTAARAGDMRVRSREIQECLEGQRGLVRRLESSVMGRVGVYQVLYRELFLGHWIVGKDVKNTAYELSDPWLGSLPVDEVEGGSATPYEVVLAVSHTSMW